ncbi:DUF1015 family protein [Nonomuraea sp. NPDC005650]|uniref:DUF1015 family protein n=1 Tax=Nonomuraea sp. NPDC005650 TaxID=3157045 RepID=UPI0033A6F00F
MGIPELPMPDGLVLRPFRGVRFAVEDPARVTSPPYDLISDADVDALLDSHPNNVVRLILPRSPRSDSSAQPPNPYRQQESDRTPHAHTAAHRPSADGEPTTAQQQAPTPATPPDAGLATRYAGARDTLRAWLDAGVLVPDEVPALYVYEQSGPNILQRGLIGDVGLADPGQRIILPHEDVMPGPIADRLALMSTTKANLEPIFLLYNGDNGAATRLVDMVASTRLPLVSAHTEDGLTHRLWAITDTSEIDAINADLHDRQALIADGHHRYATYRVLQRQEHATHRSHQPEPAIPTIAPRPEPSAPTASAQPEPSAPTIAHPVIAAEAQQPTTAPGQLHIPSEAPLSPSPVGPAAQPSHPVIPSVTQSSPSAKHIDEEEKPRTPGVPRASDAPDGPGEPGSERSSGGPATPEPLVGPWDFGLALLVDSTAYPPNLQAIHRVIPGLPLSEATAKARGAWQVHDFDDLAQGLAALKEAAEPAFLLAGEGGVHLLTNPDPVQLARAMPPDHSDRWNSLNTSVLSEFVLPKVWGMRDDEQAVRIVHHNTDAAVRLAIRTGGTAVLLKPLAVDDVLAVAAGGERVPRKSTSFGPKPRTGLILRMFAID